MQKFKEDEAQGVHGAARVDVVRVGGTLLGAHVLQRTDELTDIRLQRGDGHVRVGTTRHAKVDDLHLAR